MKNLLKLDKKLARHWFANHLNGLSRKDPDQDYFAIYCDTHKKIERGAKNKILYYPNNAGALSKGRGQQV